MNEFERLKGEAEYLVTVILEAPYDVAVVVVMDALIALRHRSQDETILEVERLLIQATRVGGDVVPFRGRG